jgi:hypothetical protein
VARTGKSRRLTFIFKTGDEEFAGLKAGMGRNWINTRENSQTSGLAVYVGSNFSKADTGKILTSGNLRHQKQTPVPIEPSKLGI